MGAPAAGHLSNPDNGIDCTPIACCAKEKRSPAGESPGETAAGRPGLPDPPQPGIGDQLAGAA